MDSPEREISFAAALDMNPSKCERYIHIFAEVHF
jgi:hypothetical protein